jgi:hypothetical protein
MDSPVELPVQSSRYTLSNTSLSNTGRTDHTYDLSFYRPPQLADRQELEDSVLDILETIMILVEHLDGVLDVKVLRRVNAPRDLCQPVQVVSCNAREQTGSTRNTLESGGLT